MDPDNNPKVPDIRFIRDDSQLEKIEELNEIISMLRHRYDNPDIDAAKRFLLSIMRGSMVLKKKRAEKEAEEKKVEAEEQAEEDKKQEAEKEKILHPDVEEEESILPPPPDPDVLGEVELPEEGELEEGPKNEHEAAGYESSLIHTHEEEVMDQKLHDIPVDLTEDMFIPGSKPEIVGDEAPPIPVPDGDVPMPSPEMLGESEDEEQIFTLDKEYPFVVFRDPGGRVLSQTEIEHAGSELAYNLHEPEVDTELLKVAKEMILKKFRKDKEILKDNSFVMKTLKKAFSKKGIEYTDDYKEELRYYLFRDLVGVGRIDPLLHDPNVVGVECEGIEKPLKVTFAPAYEMRTNVSFVNNEDLNRQVNLLATKVGKKLNEKEPVVQGKYFDFDVSLTLGIGGASSKFTLKR